MYTLTLNINENIFFLWRQISCNFYLLVGIVHSLYPLPIRGSRPGFKPRSHPTGPPGRRGSRLAANSVSKPTKTLKHCTEVLLFFEVKLFKIFFITEQKEAEFCWWNNRMEFTSSKTMRRREEETVRELHSVGRWKVERESLKIPNPLWGWDRLRGASMDSAL